ncbi:GIY-YIG nuclease family protein [Patescibacteria group bacterium]|nr:GIY-YIG nuclease family protein [Patescibacteria group bacterium]
MFYVYILQSQKNNRLYTGSTNDLARRLKEHNFGTSKYTKLTKPFKLLYEEKLSTRSGALKRERFFKSGLGREWIKKNVQNNKGG